jgi:hypothetical protein
VPPLADPNDQLAAVLTVLKRHRYCYQDEHQLQEGLAQALTLGGLPAEREVRLSARSRLDIRTGRVGIEVKVAGTADAALRQLRRYAEHPDLDALVLVTTRAAHRALPDQIGGKPLAVFYQGGAA